MGAVITTNTTTLLAILNCIHFVGAIIAETLMARTFAGTLRLSVKYSGLC